MKKPFFSQVGSGSGFLGDFVPRESDLDLIKLNKNPYRNTALKDITDDSLKLYFSLLKLN